MRLRSWSMALSSFSLCMLYGVYVEISHTPYVSSFLPSATLPLPNYSQITSPTYSSTHCPNSQSFTTTTVLTTMLNGHENGKHASAYAPEKEMQSVPSYHQLLWRVNIIG